MRLPLALLALATLGAAPAPSGLTVYVRGPGNQPVRDAVVTLHLLDRTAPVAAGGAYSVNQKDIQFHPFVLVVPVNSDVSFPNFDSVRHHVYSFSSAKKFELKLYAKDQSRSVRFDKPGIVALGCNIHDQMAAFIDVVDTPFAIKTDATGNAVFTGLPEGARVRLEVWQPYLRAPNNLVAREVAAGGAETVSVTLRSPPRMTGTMQY